MKSISINEHKLHEVQMLMEQYSEGTVSYLKYPKHRIQFEIEGAESFLKIPALLALELYRRAILPQYPMKSVSIKVSGKKVGEFQVVDFRYSDRLSRGSEMVRITFQKVNHHGWSKSRTIHHQE